MTKELTPLRRKDQATGYQAAVRDIVEWLRKEAPAALHDPRMAASALEAKFGNPNVAD